MYYSCSLPKFYFTPFNMRYGIFIPSTNGIYLKVQILATRNVKQCIATECEARIAGNDHNV